MPLSHRMKTFSIQHSGKSWSGEWSFSDGVVSVDSAYGSARRAVAGRGAKAADLADVLLKEIVLKYIEDRMRRGG